MLRTRLLGALLFMIVLTSLASLLYLLVSWIYPAGDIALHTGLSAGLTLGYIGLALLLADRTFETAIGLREADPRELREDRAIQFTRELTQATGLPMPRVYIQSGDELNAFAYGLSRRSALVGVTDGALTRLTDDELRAVLAHEIAHIENRDIIETTAGLAVLGGLEVGLRGLWGIAHGLAQATAWSGHRRRFKTIYAILPFLLMVIVGLARTVAWLATRVGEVAYFAHSRQKEYLADATSARSTGKPMALASALRRIARHPPPASRRPGTVAAAYIFPDPPQRKGPAFLYATHPPLEKRIARLETMEGL